MSGDSWLFADTGASTVMSGKIEIYVATHKETPTPFPAYCPKIRVNSLGKEDWDGYLRDDKGDNISDKNYCYCELTALYTLWKNSDADIKGLFHYRRILGNKEKPGLMDVAWTYMGIMPGEVSKYIIKEDEIRTILSEYDLILPLDDCPFGLTALEDLRRFVYPDDIKVMTDVIEEKYPEYSKALWEVLGRHHISYCNMFIASAGVTDAYCEWIFDVLAEVEKRVDISDYDTQHKRIFGYLSEVLLNAYVLKNALSVKRVNYIAVYDTGAAGKVMIWAKRLMNAALACMGIYPLVRIRTSNKAKYDEYERYLKGDPRDSGNDIPSYRSIRDMLTDAGVSDIDEDGGYTLGRIVYRDEELILVVRKAGETEGTESLESEASRLLEYCETLRNKDKTPGHFYYPRIAYTIHDLGDTEEIEGAQDIKGNKETKDIEETKDLNDSTDIKDVRGIADRLMRRGITLTYIGG